MLVAGMWSRLTGFLSMREPEEDELVDDVYGEQAQKIVPLAEARSRRVGGVSVFYPRRYDDVTEIADGLRARIVVVVNLIGADRVLSQRVVDFLSGVVYTLDGKMQRVAEGIYLFAPSNVPVSAQEHEVATATGYQAI